MEIDFGMLVGNMRYRLYQITISTRSLIISYQLFFKFFGKISKTKVTESLK